MRSASTPSRVAAFVGAGLVAGGGPSLMGTAVSALFLGLLGWFLERTLRREFDSQAAFWSTLAWTLSVPVARAPGGLGVNEALFLVAGAGALHVSISLSAPLATLACVSVAVAPTVLEAPSGGWRDIDTFHMVTGLWGSGGVFYNAPLFLLGAGGLAIAARTGSRSARPALLGLAAGVLTLALLMETTDPLSRSTAWMPLTLPGLAVVFSSLLKWVERRPAVVLAGGGVLLCLWNVLFMEQYRRRLLPNDDTVSFPVVTSNNAALLSKSLGTPFAWPANWAFAASHGVSPDRWDAVAGLRLFSPASPERTVVEIGDDDSPWSMESALVVSGFGERRTCGSGWCRNVDDTGRLLIPIRNPGFREVLITLRARGSGTLTLEFENLRVAAELTDEFANFTLRVPKDRVRPVNAIRISVENEGRATVDRLVVERSLVKEQERP